MSRDENGNLVPERYLYRRRYSKSSGKPVTRFYALFTDWQGIRRRFPLGDKLENARRNLAAYLRKNDAEVDFDKEKAERKAKGMTFGKWAAQCQKSDHAHVRLHLEPFFGSMPLARIDDDAVRDYRKERAAETVIRHKKKSKKLVTQTTINKEVATLRKLLRLARKKGYSDSVTGFEMAPEKNRKRVLSGEEYTKLLAKCPAWLRRACTMAWETALSRSDLLALTWDEIDLKEGIIALKNDRAKTGAGAGDSDSHAGAEGTPGGTPSRAAQARRRATHARRHERTCLHDAGRHAD
jgi:integrase